jgi:hypothetical protein
MNVSSHSTHFFADLQATAHAADQKARALMALVRISSASSSSLLGADANKASPSISRANSRDELLPPPRPLLAASLNAPLRTEPSASSSLSASAAASTGSGGASTSASVSGTAVAGAVAVASGAAATGSGRLDASAAPDAASADEAADASETGPLALSHAQSSELASVGDVIARIVAVAKSVLCASHGMHKSAAVCVLSCLSLCEPLCANCHVSKSH